MHYRTMSDLPISRSKCDQRLVAMLVIRLRNQKQRSPVVVIQNPDFLFDKEMWKDKWMSDN